MINLMKTEIMKLKNSWIFMVSLIPVVVLPFFGLLLIKLSRGDQSEYQLFKAFLQQNHIFHTLLVGTLLYSLMTITLFLQEFKEKTLREILMVPVSRSRYLMSKLAVLLLWILLLTAIMIGVCLILALPAGLKGVTGQIYMQGAARFVGSAVLLFFLTLPVILLTIVFKGYIVPLCFTIVTFIGNIIAFNTKEFIFYYPWSIPFVLTNFREKIDFSRMITSTSIVVLFGGAVMVIMMIYFSRMDVE